MKTYTEIFNLLKSSFLEGSNSLRKRGSFAQNFAFILSGTGLNILVQIFVTPIITRLYGPEAYGNYSLFNALCVNLALIVSLRLPQAVILPKGEDELKALFRVGMLSALGLSMIIFIILYLYTNPILSFFNANTLASFYYLIPLMVLLITLNQYVGSWQYRLNAFKKSIALDTGTLIGVRVFNLSYGLISNGMVMGLVFGDILGKLTGLLLAWVFVIRDKVRSLVTFVPGRDLIKVIKTYKVYPLLNLPGAWMDTVSAQLPVFYISSVFGMSSVGLLALAVSMLDLPKRLFAYSVTSLFYKKTNDLYSSSLEELQKFIPKVFYFLLLISSVPYAILFVWGHELFTLAFGGQWSESGLIARYLSVYYIFELLTISVTPIFYVFRKESKLFLFQFLFLVFRISILAIAFWFRLSIESTILILSIVNCILYNIQLGYILHIVQLKWYKYITISSFVVSTTYATLYLLSMLIKM